MKFIILATIALFSVPTFADHSEIVLEPGNSVTVYAGSDTKVSCESLVPVNKPTCRIVSENWKDSFGKSCNDKKREFGVAIDNELLLCSVRLSQALEALDDLRSKKACL